MAIFESEETRDKPISLGISAGEEYRRKRNEAAENEKIYKNLKNTQKVNLFLLLLLCGLLIFCTVLIIDGLVVRGILPGRATNSAIVVNKTETAKTINKTRRIYTVYWRKIGVESAPEQSTSLLFEDWNNIQQEQEIKITSGLLFRELIIIGTKRTSTTDLAIKIAGWFVTLFLIIYFLCTQRKNKEKISQFEGSR